MRCASIWKAATPLSFTIRRPIPLVRHLRNGRVPWIWQFQFDLSEPNRAIWDYVSRFVEQYTAAVFSLPDYTVTEAMWKGAAVIGGNVPGIRRQIRNGENGF
jgi:hypothetical protein